MKDTLAKIGLKVQDLSDLLSIPATTIHSWFARRTFIPSRFSMYFTMIEVQASKVQEPDLNTLLATQIEEEKPREESAKEWRMKRQLLSLNLRKNELKLEKLKRQRAKMLKKQIVAQNLPESFPPNYEHLPAALEWMDIWRRKGRLQTGKLIQQIWTVELKITSLKAQLAYLDQWGLGEEIA